MKNYAILLSALIMIAPGCFATMPAPVKDIYLVEKTSEEDKLLAGIEDEIININKQNNQAKESAKIIRQEISVSEARIGSLERNKSYNLELEKLYSISNDNAKLAEVKRLIQQNDDDMKKETAHLEYLKAKKDNQESSVDVKDAELSVKVAELYYEKSKIARKFQDKTMVAAPVEGKEPAKEDRNKIDVDEYRKYLDSQKDKLAKAQAAQKKYADAFIKAEAKLKESGY